MLANLREVNIRRALYRLHREGGEYPVSKLPMSFNTFVDAKHDGLVVVVVRPDRPPANRKRWALTEKGKAALAVKESP